jgi:hypothetical protein
MAWRTATSLLVLRDQLNAAFPNRSKASDGFIGDTAHAASASDHNPNAAGVVCAFDITHDPANGLDAHALADSLITNRHPDLKYVISNRRIAGAWSYWRWTAYAGTDPHDTHIHISVGVGEDGQSTPPYDDETKWDIGGGMDRETLNYIFRLSADAEPDKATVDYWLGRPARDFAKSRYENNEPFRYGGRHYKEDTTALQATIALLQKQLADNDAAKKLQAIKDALK